MIKRSLVIEGMLDIRSSGHRRLRVINIDDDQLDDLLGQFDDSYVRITVEELPEQGVRYNGNEA